MSAIWRCVILGISGGGDFHRTFMFYNGLRYIKYRSISKFSRALLVRYTWSDSAE